MPDSPSRVILDPSVLFREEALAWMGTPELGEHLVVSDALRRRMDNPAELARELEDYGVSGVSPEMVESVRGALEEGNVRPFSYQRAREEGELPEGTIAICRELLEIDGPLADVLADEWAFVTSQSLAVLAEDAGRALGAFARAGARVIGIPRQRMVAALGEARAHIPPGLLERMKSVSGVWERFPKLLVAGGELAAHVLVPPLGIAVGVAELLLEGNAVLAGDP